MSDSASTLANAARGSASELRRLGKNINGYGGETIDIASVLDDCATAACKRGWRVEEIPCAPKPLLALTRRGSRAKPASGSRSDRTHLYISTGIHGDEPAGPLAARQLLQEDQWPAALDIWFCPCLNPAGFALNRRENSDGLDLNREYRQTKAAETTAHIGWLQRQPNFDLCLCLHEDWESCGFYVYELNPDNRPSPAEAMIRQVAQVCPIDQSEMIEGRPARNGIIRPGIDPNSRPQWPEAFYLLINKTRLTCTLEAPSDFPISDRVAALVAGVNAALGTLPCLSAQSR